MFILCVKAVDPIHWDGSALCNLSVVLNGVFFSPQLVLVRIVPSAIVQVPANTCASLIL